MHPARKASLARMQVSLRPGQIHVTAAWTCWLPEAREELALGARWLAERLHPGFGDVDSDQLV